MHMKAIRSERFSVNLTPAALARLDAYAEDHHWTRSMAAALLIEQGLQDHGQAAS
jgi:hypothetical protein